MAYTDRKSIREHGEGIVGVAIIHAGLAALLLTGLSVGTFIQSDPGPLVSHTFEDPPPPPPSDPQPKPQNSPSDSITTVPKPPKPIPDNSRLTVPPFVDAPYSDEIKLVPLPPLDPPGSGAAIAASPRNNAANWVTDSDYKSRWIREGLYGSASFRLEVANNGRVANCRIIRSTGHAALDRATCELIAKRARFSPAKDSDGNLVAGSYSGSINWMLPD